MKAELNSISKKTILYNILTDYMTKGKIYDEDMFQLFLFDDIDDTTKCLLAVMYVQGKEKDK